MDEAVQDNLAGESVSGDGDAANVECLETATDAEVMVCLQEVAEELNSTLELDALLKRVSDRVRQAIGFDTFGVQLLDPLGQELRIRFGVGYPPEVVEHWRLGLGQGLVGTAAKTGQPVLVGDVRTDSRYINAGENISSELAVPLQVKNRTIGVLSLGSRRPHYFHQNHLRFLTFLAGHLANAIENARLYENLREQARTLSLLHEISRQLTSILDQEELLGTVAKLVKRLIDYQGFHVMLWDAEKQALEHGFSIRYDERIHNKASLALGIGICGTAAALRQPLRVPNVHLDPRYVSCGDAVEVKSELVVPLVFKDQLLGVIDLESTEYNAFTEQHEEMLSTLASTVAIALENARLYQKLREEEQRLETDLATARDIQQRLLPDSAPRLPGLEVGFAYAPARQLGGDVYDFLPYGDGRLAIAVGDVAGKATAAALYGSLAIGILRGHVVEHPCEPAEMLELINEHLQQPRIDNRYVALVFAVFDSRSKTLTVANSGFPRPRLVRGGRVEEVMVDGVPLGLLPDSRYEQKKLALQVGDIIVLCSDGLHECMNKQEEQFGSVRLNQILQELAGGSAQAVAEGLIRATDRYAFGNDGQADDRTVVVLRVTRE